MSTVPGRRPNQIEPMNHKFMHANNKVYPCASKLEMADQSALSCPLSQTLQEAFEKLGFNSVKPEQQLAVAGIMKADVFVILPTGFGKSACYQCLPCNSFESYNEGSSKFCLPEQLLVISILISSFIYF